MLAALLTGSNAYAQSTTFDVAGQPLLFTGAGSGSGVSVNSTRDYANVITLNGTQIDARVTLTELSNATLSTFDSLSNPYGESTFFQPNVTISAPGGYARFRVDFFANGQPVTLQNFYVNTYDLDGSGSSAAGRQYTEFGGYASYTLSDNTNVVMQGGGSGTRFITTVGGNLNYAVGTSDFNSIRARVFYTSASSVTVTVGDTGASGIAYYGLDFSIGYPFGNVAPDNTAPVVAADQSFNYAENQTANAVVGQVSGSDAVGVTGYRFAATSSQTSADGLYTINSSGSVSITAAGVAAGVANNDFETAPNSFVYAVQAGDAAGNWSAATNITLNVTDVDDSLPVITGPGGTASSAVEVDEGTTAVTTLTASETVTWSVLPAGDGGLFTISPAGALSFVAAPDYDNPADADANNIYTVTVEGRDASGNAATHTVTVTVRNVDNTVPVITGPGGTTSSAVEVNEGTTAVTTLVADESVTWSVLGTGDGGLFTIDNAGALSFATAPDFESPADADGDNVYVLTVEARDSADNVATHEVTVTVLDLDDTLPVITGPGGTASSATEVDEGATAVTSFTASEAVTWSVLAGGDGALFTIDAAGELSFVAAPDYESPADADFNNVYLLTLEARDAAGNAATHAVTVTVLDLDDTLPVITGPDGSSSSAVEVDEGTTAVATFSSSEPVTWSVLAGGDGALFTISSGGALSFAAAPDYESPADADGNNVYLLTLEGRDAAGNTATHSVTVTVLDIDDTLPVITGPGGSASTSVEIDEGTTAVITLSSSESVTWTIVSGGDSGLFTIGSSGAISFLAAPDYESPADVDGNNVYQFNVEATDGAGNTATHAVTVTVRDLDDTLPVVTGPGGSASSAIEVDEGTVIVTTLTASESVAWSVLPSGDGARFTIDASGVLSFVSAPDYESPADADSNNVYLLTVEARDPAGNSTTHAVTVTVRDLDDTLPIVPGNQSFSYAENRPANAVVGQVSSSDTVGVTAYRFAATSSQTSADGFYTIDASGTLRLTAAGAAAGAATNDYEVAPNSFVHGVQAGDAAGNWSVATNITLNVTDVDDTLPVITGPGGSASSAVQVNEGTLPALTLTSSEAVTWSLLAGGDAARFTITAAGAISFVAAPDYENPADADANNVYQFTVQARDSAGNVATHAVTVTVRDLDDTLPVITGPGGSASSAVDVDEGIVPVLTLTSSEAVTWSVLSGGDGARFTISAAGAISFVAAPDYENPSDGDANNIYLLTVQARDAAGNTSTHAVTVTVRDLDDTLPVISGPGGNASSAVEVDEGTTAVATISANEPVTWSVLTGGDGALFTISPAGALSFVAAPDYESPADADANNVYELVLQARDTSGNTATHAVTVTVRDLDDTLPVITGPGGSASTAVEVDEGTIAVTTLSSSETVTWSLLSGGDASRFAISPAGALSFVTAPDYEAPADADGNNLYVLTVEARDDAGNAATHAVTVTVRDLDDTLPVITGPGGGASTSVEVDEGTTGVASFSGNESVTWSILSGGDGAFFTISPAGELSFTTAPDYESPADADSNNVYSLTIEARDAAGNGASHEVIVTVRDLDDTLPVITGPGGSDSSNVAVDEDSDSVVTFTSSENVTWSVVPGGDGPLFTITPTGELSFITRPNFEDPSDADRNNVYEVVVEARDAAGNTAIHSVTIVVQDIDDTQPVITGPGGATSTSVEVDEGTIAVTTLTSSEEVTWSIAAGNDGALFTISPAGALSFTAAPDFESPADADRNNVYLLTVEARDAAGNVASHAVSVTVRNFDELGQRLAEISSSLRGDLRSQAFRSLQSMLSFNEQLMRSTFGSPTCGTDGRALSGRLDANETSQSADVAFSRKPRNCDMRTRFFADAGASLSGYDGEWGLRGFGSLRLEHDVSKALTLGAGVIGSFADEELTSFSRSRVSDHSLQGNLYGRLKLTENLRFGAFAGYGKAWYDFSLDEGGLSVSGKMTGDRHLYGAALSGDVQIGGIKITTDAVLSRAFEDLGSARMRAALDQDERSGLELQLGKVDATRLSVPVTVPITLKERGELGGEDVRLTLSPGLLCEDVAQDSSKLTCGYQLGAGLDADLNPRNFVRAELRHERVNGFEQNVASVGYMRRLGKSNEVQLGVSLDHARGAETPDTRLMLRLAVGR